MVVWCIQKREGRKKMYTIKNYKSRKEMVTDFKSGKQIKVYQPGGIFKGKTDGRISIEGPHYPQPHKWYASVTIKDSIIIGIK
jgi:hypothetical protein